MAESAKAKAEAAAAAKADEKKDDEAPEAPVDDSLNGRLNALWVEINESYNDDAPGLKTRVLAQLEALQFGIRELEPYKK